VGPKGKRGLNPEAVRAVNEGMGEIDVLSNAAEQPTAGIVATNGHGAGLGQGWGTPASYRVPTQIRWFFGITLALVVAFVISLIVRPVGSYFQPIDGWGISLLEVAVGFVCISRYFERSWHGSNPIGRTFPLALGAASASWGIGDLVLTGLGGPNVTPPSAADLFYIGFFLLCFCALALLIRRGNRSSLVATALDGLIAGLAVAAVAAAFVVSEVINVTGDGRLAAVTQLVYPLGDVLLLALCIGGFAVLPRGYRRFFGLAGIALAANALGDAFNLLQPNSRFGYIANGAAWPISLTLLAIAAWLLHADIEAPRVDRVPGFTLPSIGALIGLVVLFLSSVAHIGRPAVGLATATLLVAGVRLVLSAREVHALKSARFTSLIDKTWDLIVVAEADLRVAFITPSSERVLGYAAEELEGRVFADLVHPDDSAVLIEQMTSLPENESDAVTFEVRMRHANGEYRVIAWTAANHLHDASVKGYVLNGGDVTDARQAAADLVAARDAAMAASKTKSEFVSMMSHEIRTPMNGVIGLTELLLETELDKEQSELASGVKISAERLLVIINDILDFSKIEAGKLEIEETPIDVHDVADDVGRILASMAHGKGLELLVDVQPEVPDSLLGDGTRIQQILLNFGSNAVKFTANGEVMMRVKVLHENAERVALRFEVSDTGLGISPEDQERLFSAFTQADSSTTRKYGGTGLGLTICRQLVELMGGRLGLESAPGQGSTFWFELSLRRTHDSPAERKSGDTRTLSGQRALIVDDNATNRRILRQQLRSWGVEAVEAEDGFEALEIAGTAAQDGRAFDLGVIDLNMPGMDGMELARELKANAATASTMLFLLSSSGNRLEPGESHLTGFAASLTKPVRSSELFDCLITTMNSGLNADGEAMDAAERPDKAAVAAGAAGTILLVEDNKVNQMVGSKVLQNLGYRYDIANNGLEAVRAFEAGSYDAVLMDCQMPEMDGYEATGAIRRLEADTDAVRTPIIAMTAAAMEGDREACLASGMDDFMTKPVRLEIVATVLARWVGSHATPDGEHELSVSGPVGVPS
jgi:two-component system sensor histidine kinase/response regulator